MPQDATKCYEMPQDATKCHKMQQNKNLILIVLPLENEIYFMTRTEYIDYEPYRCWHVGARHLSDCVSFEIYGPCPDSHFDLLTGDVEEPDEVISVSIDDCECDCRCADEPRHGLVDSLIDIIWIRLGQTFDGWSIVGVEDGVENLGGRRESVLILCSNEGMQMWVSFDHPELQTEVERLMKDNNFPLT
jgi:hypothetical protein